MRMASKGLCPQRNPTRSPKLCFGFVLKSYQYTYITRVYYTDT